MNLGEPAGRPRDALATTAEIFQLDELAAQVGFSAGVPVPVRRVSLSEVSDAGYLLYGRIFDWFDGGREMATRTVVFDLPRPLGGGARILHDAGYVAGVDSMQVFQWNRDTRDVAQIYGLESVARDIGGDVFELGRAGEYCFFASNRAGETLPSLLARYLIAHHRVRARGGQGR